MALGPKTLVVKRGEYGVMMFTADAVFAAPAYPLEEVFDPPAPATPSPAASSATSMASAPHPEHGELRRAMVRGSALASFNVEDFGTERVRRLERGGHRRPGPLSRA